MPRAYGLLGEVPELRELMNNPNDQLCKEASRRGQSGPIGDGSSFGMFDMDNVSHLSSGAKYLKLKWRKFDHLAGQLGGARSIFCELFGHQKAENTFWLDSSSTEKVSGCSFISHY